MKFVTLALFSQLFWDSHGLKVRGHPENNTAANTPVKFHTSQRHNLARAFANHSLVHVHLRQGNPGESADCTEICQYAPNACQNRPSCKICAICQDAPKPPLITYKSRKYNGNRLQIGKAKDFLDRVRSGQTGWGYCEKSLSALTYTNKGTCDGKGVIRNIGFDITVEFEEKYGSMWHFNFGVDFGLGGVVFVDGEKVKSFGGDVWWAHNANHPNQLGFGYFFKQGRHKLELIGAEGCCDGWSVVKFCANCETETGMEVVSIENLEKAFAHNIEVGEFEMTEDWQEVKFMLTFTNKPVVILLANDQSETPVSARLAEVYETGFWAFLSQIGYADVKLPMKVTYIAMERGVINLPDGRAVEAGVVDGMGMTKDSHTISFTHHFGSEPAMATLLQTAEHAESFTRVATQQLTKGGAEISLEMPAESEGAFYADEQVGWIAIEQGYGTFPARDIDDSNKQVSYTAKVYSMDCDSKEGEFIPEFDSKPLVVGSRIAPKDGGWLKFDGVSEKSAKMVTTDAKSCSEASSKFMSLIAFSGKFFA